MLERIYQIVLGPAVLLSLIVVGGYFCVRLKLFWFCHPRRAIKEMTGSRGIGGTVGAVCMALAGTLGVGNIAGVALALMLGGPGAILWMLVSAFFAMAVKYAEVLLAMDTRRKKGDAWEGGAHFYIAEGGKDGKYLAPLFASLCVACAVLQGSVIQGSAAAEAISLSFGIKPIFAGFALTFAAVSVLTFGRRGIARVTTVAIPLATCMYMTMCLATIVAAADNLPTALYAIVRGAFAPTAGVGGVLGFFVSRAAREGCAKGLLSNEAGCGTAPMAHVTAEGTTPAGQALWGVFEVFLDTAVICVLTALACLCVSPAGSPDAPIAYITRVFTPVWGVAALPLTAFCIVTFAFATTLTWSFYGATCLNGITRSPLVQGIYLTLYTGALICGSIGSPTILYTVTDILLALMTLINLAVLAKKADRVVALSANAGLLKISCKRGCGTGERHRQKPSEKGSPHTRAR